MVEGQKIEGKRPLVVIDLDGTLVKGNTFRIFVKCGLRHLLRKHAYFKYLTACFLLAMRKIDVINHRTLKFSLLPLFGDDKRLLNDFASEALPRFNASVTSLLDDYKQKGYATLLATAAADTYITSIWNGVFQATPMQGNAAHIENRGELKRDNALRYADENGMKIAAVVTDHADDLPLLSLGVENILVSPTEKNQKIIDAHNIKYRLLR